MHNDLCGYYSLPLCENLTSSTKPEVVNVGYRNAARRGPSQVDRQNASQSLVKFKLWFSRYARAQTDSDMFTAILRIYSGGEVSRANCEFLV